MRSFKILVSCYACDPYEGSEPGMGWNFVSNLGHVHDLHVITEQKFQNSLEKKMEESPELFRNLHFHFIIKSRHKTLRKIWPPSYYWFYKRWQKDAYKLAIELDRTENFDIIHQLNMVGFREPGYLWKMNKPFVWGPIGGMENTDFKLLLNLGLNNFVYLLSRNIINYYQKRFLNRPKQAANARQSFLIAATLGNKQNILKFWNRESMIIPEVGYVPSSNESVNPRDPAEPLLIIWSGQHEAKKALNILLKSLRVVPSRVKWKLIILGTGPMTRRWKNLAEKYKISDRCEWTGWISLDEAHRKMQQAHLVCITSLKDLTSTLTLEALSFGLPVLCLDHCGFANIVNEDCGIKIPIDYPGPIMKNLSAAIEKLFSDEMLRKQMSQAAILRAREFGWEEKIAQINEVYESLIE